MEDLTVITQAHVRSVIQFIKGYLQSSKMRRRPNSRMTSLDINLSGCFSPPFIYRSELKNDIGTVKSAGDKKMEEQAICS